MTDRQHHHRAPDRHGTATGGAAALAAGAGLVALGAVAMMRAGTAPRDSGARDSAPGRTSRRTWFGDYVVEGRSVTINRPRHELYAFWRDFTNLARFMGDVEKVTTDGEVSTWTVSAPAGRSVTLRTRVVSDREDEQIAWRSCEGSDVDTEGKVSFRDAPAGRGTVVEATIAYIPPGGEAGRLAAKLFQKEPRVQGRRELKRFKMFMETGEVSTARNRLDA